MVDRLATTLGELGHGVTLACGGPTGVHAYDTVDLGGRYGQYLRAPLVVHRRLRDYDAVIDVANGIPFFSPLWQRRPTVCLVTHVHRDQWAQHLPMPLAKLGWFLEQRVVPRVYARHRFAAISGSTATSIAQLGVDPRSIDVLPLGIDQPDREWPRSPDPLFVAVGRLVPHKRIDLLLQAWEAVRPVVGGRLVIIGGGRDLETLRAHAGHAVEFTGRISDEERARWMGEAWLLVHAAHHEGWGMVIMEAAVAGTPSLAFDVPGVRDAIADGTTGVLVATLSEFVAQWVALAQDEALRAAQGIAARNRAAAFTWAATAERLVQIATARRTMNDDVPPASTHGARRSPTTRRSSPSLRAGILPPTAALAADGTPVDPGRLPNFFLLGAPKAGTTSIHAYLRQHPQIFLPYVKEIGFFQIDAEFSRGLAYLANSYYPHTNRYRARGDATQMYFANEFAADRILRSLPRTSHRFILVLRDPVERAYSNYFDMVRQRVERESFERGLELESERLRSDPLQSGAYGYVTNSLYAARLRPWIERFGRERFLLLFFDDLRDNPQSVVDCVCEFLGVDGDVKLPSAAPLNSADTYRMGVLPWLWRPPRWMKRALGMPFDARRRAAIMQFVDALDAKAMKSPPLSIETADRLREVVVEDVIELERLTGRDLSSWRQTNGS